MFTNAACDFKAKIIHNHSYLLNWLTRRLHKRPIPLPSPSSRYATPAHWGGLVGHGACSVTYSVQQFGHVPSHSVTVDTPEQSHPIVSVSRYTQSGTMQPEMLGHAGGTVDVMTAQGGGGGGVVVGQSVAVTTNVGTMQPGQQSVSS